MLIDIVFILLLFLAVIKGYSRGFIIAIFSFLSFIIGLAAAMKFSVIVGQWLSDSININGKWLPIIAFILVMLIVGFIVRWCAMLIERSLQLMMLGFINKLAGILLYAALYTLVFSVILFYAVKMQLLKPETIASSRFYRFIQPWGSKVIDSFGFIIPWFKNMFSELTDFFQQVADKAATK